MVKPRRGAFPWLLTAIYEVFTMKMDEVIARINVLAKKAKTEGLTEEETAERDKLRRIYIDSVKSNLTAQLDNTYLVDEKGNKRKLNKKQ